MYDDFWMDTFFTTMILICLFLEKNVAAAKFLNSFESCLLMTIAYSQKKPIWKMSECLWTYGPQIIRVPQLQSEDWAIEHG